MFGIFSIVETGLVFSVKTAIPNSKTTLIISSIISGYGYQMALAHAPAYLTQYYIKKFGYTVGTFIVAPALVPSFTPTIALGVWAATFVTTATICNLFHRIIILSGKKHPPFADNRDLANKSHLIETHPVAGIGTNMV
jgi:hypothetical protein